MGRWWWRRCVVAIVGCLGLVALACGGVERNEQVKTGEVADVLGFAAGSGDKVLHARTFRYSVTDRRMENQEYATFCRIKTTVEGAADTGRRRRFLDLTPEAGAEVVVSEDTMWAKASALPTWRLPRPWLAVDLESGHGYTEAMATLGLQDLPRVREGDDADPVTGLASLRAMVTDVSERGHEEVRGVDTTRFDMTIDPEKAGLWTGGTTTTTVPDSRPSAEAVRRRRQYLLDTFFAQALAKQGQTIPDEASQAFLNGDAGPLVRFAQQHMPSSAKPEDATLWEIVVADDPDQAMKQAESRTGTTVSRVDHCDGEDAQGRTERRPGSGLRAGHGRPRPDLGDGNSLG